MRSRPAGSRHTRLTISVTIVALWFAAVLGCERCPSKQATEPPGIELEQQVSTDPQSPQQEPETAEPVAPQPIGEDLFVWPTEVMLETDGLVLERQAWQLGNLRGRAWRVRLPTSGTVRIEPAEEIAAFTDFLPGDEGPWAAINGGFYDRDLAPMGLVVADGVEHHPLRSNGGSGVFAMTENGPTILHRTDWEPGPVQALQSIDRLIDAGASVVSSRDDRGAARSAVAVGPDHLWLIVAASDDSIRVVPDGVWLRWTARSGLPLWAFADYILGTTNALSALNLDGGGSTNLVVKTRAQQFRVIGERGTINAIVVRP